MQKPTRSKVIKKLDAVFSEYIRLRDCDTHGIVTCPLCGTKVPWKKAQNMHFISRAVMKYRYNEDNCHAGCMRCNVILHGNYKIYTRRMQVKYGIQAVDNMLYDKGLYKVPTWELEVMIQKYAQQVKALTTQKHLY